MELRYSIFDPTGTITALVETAVEPVRRQEAAAVVMRLHPEVEQVGFVRDAASDGLPELNMAGGEFCGNASMCAAALFALQSGGGGASRLGRRPAGGGIAPSVGGGQLSDRAPDAARPGDHRAGLQL